MTDRVPIEIEMRADGSFVEPPRLTWGQRILRVALVIAGLAALVAAGFLLVGLALLLIPAALGAAAVAWGMLRYRMWKLSRR
jgi:hypothetical protein